MKTEAENSWNRLVYSETNKKILISPSLMKLSGSLEIPEKNIRNSFHVTPCLTCVANKNSTHEQQEYKNNKIIKNKSHDKNVLTIENSYSLKTNILEPLKFVRISNVLSKQRDLNLQKSNFYSNSTIFNFLVKRKSYSLQTIGIPMIIQMLLLVLMIYSLIPSTIACRLSEFTCGNYDCVPADSYCDGQHDCEDKSDEPRDCSRKF